MRNGMGESLRAAGACLCLAFTLGGCNAVVGDLVGVAYISLERETDLRAAREKRAVIVLIRAAATQDGTRLGGAPIQVHAYAEEKTKDGDRWERWPWPYNNMLSPEASDAHWRYWVRSQGGYRLTVQAPLLYNPQTGLSDYNVSWRDAKGASQPPSFRLGVPPGASVIYAGSLHLKCTSKWQGTGGLACSADLQAEDETKEAREIAKAHFAEFGPLATRLMRRE